MYHLKFTNAYKRSYRLMKKRGLDVSDLNDVVEQLRRGETLDEKHREPSTIGGAEELRPVRLHCEQHCLPAIQLAFGTDIPIHEQEDLRFSVSVSAPDTYGFYTWLANQGAGVTLEFPPDMRKKMGQFLRQSLSNYADVLDG